MPPGGTPDLSPNAGRKFTKRDRLHNDVARTGVQHRETLSDVFARVCHDHRHSRPVLTCELKDGPTSSLTRLSPQEQEINLLSQNPALRVGSARGARYLKALGREALLKVLSRRPDVDH